MILLSLETDGSAVDVHVFRAHRLARDAGSLTLWTWRDGEALMQHRAWFRNGMWTIRNDVTARNAPPERVAALVQQDLAEQYDVQVRKDVLIHALGAGAMGRIAIVLDVMES